MNKILIADDNQQITSILANYARKEGFEPLVALDGQQALELFEQHEKKYRRGTAGRDDAEAGRVRGLP